jgi:FKBP-type peptidyl-prolyl cis-trans isomerase 2
MSETATVKESDTVQIHFEGRLPDGTVFETSEGGDPLSFVAGSDEILPGVSQAVIGMTANDAKDVELDPQNGFGERHEELVKKVDRDQLPKDAKIGDQLKAPIGDRELIVWVRELSDKRAVLDANHPLAGVTVTFTITLVAIVEK